MSLLQWSIHLFPSCLIDVIFLNKFSYYFFTYIIEWKRKSVVFFLSAAAFFLTIESPVFQTMIGNHKNVTSQLLASYKEQRTDFFSWKSANIDLHCWKSPWKGGIRVTTLNIYIYKSDQSESSINQPKKVLYKMKISLLKIRKICGMRKIENGFFVLFCCFFYDVPKHLKSL